MFRFSFVLILLVSSLFSARLSALEVDDLYQASVPVESQARTQREQAIKLALKGVFIKVGGGENVLTNKVLRQAQKIARRYMSQYHYQRQGEQLNLVVNFNEDKVNQLFNKADLALWGSLRPQVLLWLIDEHGASRRIIAADADSNNPTSVNYFSQKRGLPIVMPLMDRTDNKRVVVSDFWHYFPERIQQASRRYFADTIVVMRISDSSLLANVACGLLCQQQQTQSPKVLDWRVYTQGALYTQQYQGVDKISLIKQGLSDITRLIYQSYALSSSAESDFVIEVKNVSSLKSDKHLYDFLADLSGVKSVTLISAQADVRRFKLDLNGSKASFLAALKLNKKLTQYVKPQLYKMIETEAVIAQSNRASGLSDNMGYQGKVIVLGQDKRVDKKMAIRHSTKGNNNLLSATAADNSSQTNLAVKPELALMPSVPVFYWEQG